KGNTSGTVYNYITGETSTFYDPAVGTTSNSSSTRKTTSHTSSSSASSYSAASVSYPAVSSASGPAYIFSSVGAVNVYTYPSADATVIARLESGTPVNVISTVGGWSEIAYGNTTGHVDARFISFTAPAVAATPIPTVIPAVPYTPTVKTATEQYVTMIKIQPVTVTVRVPQAGAAVILRWAPSETEPAISNLAEGYSLTALSMNTEWVQVYDPKTNDVGFIPRAFVNGL
ncbi:MAG: SH3 domain-containing protein, partial [Clostridia bacterium]|nr:SH3 domain-containing protein [Clostridia bacterium]